MNRALKGHLAKLPYREMKEFCIDLTDELAAGVDPDDMADTLSQLANAEDRELVTKEEDLLHSMFTRKKQITIQPYENGFKISVPAQNIDIYAASIRDGISQVLDSLVVMKVLD